MISSVDSPAKSGDGQPLGLDAAKTDGQASAPKIGFLDTLGMLVRRLRGRRSAVRSR